MLRYVILFYLLLFYLLIYYVTHILSCLVSCLSYLILSYPILSYPRGPILSYPIPSHLGLSLHVSTNALSYTYVDRQCRSRLKRPDLPSQKVYTVVTVVHPAAGGRCLFGLRVPVVHCSVEYQFVVGEAVGRHSTPYRL